MKTLSAEIERIESEEAENAYAQKTMDYVEKSFASDQGADSNGVWDEEIKAFLDSMTLKGLFFSEDWVFILVDLIANKISSQPLRVMKKVTNSDGSVSTEYNDQHPLNALFEKPNDWQDYHSWMYNLVTELFLMGNSIIWHSSQNNSLLVFPTELVTMDFNYDGTLKSYMVGTSSEDMRLATKESRLTFSENEIAHIKRPNPSSLLWGLSPFIPGRKSVLFNRYSQDYLNAFYQKQATPGIALKMDKNVNEDVAIRQLRSFELAYTGRKNARRTLIVPKGVDIQTLTHSLSDQKLGDMIDRNRETICAVLKVPKHELSLQSAGSLGSEEYKTALKNFWEATLKPAMRMIEGVLTNFFHVELGPDNFVQFDLTGVEALQDDKVQQADLATKLLSAGWSVNEVRQEVYEKEPSTQPDADTPFNLIAKSAPAPFAFSSEAPSQLEVEAPEERSVETDQSDKITVDQVRAHLNRCEANYIGGVNKALDEEEADKGRKLTDLVLDTFIEFADSALSVLKEELEEEKSYKRIATPFNKNVIRRELVVKAKIPSVSELNKRLKKAFADLEKQWVENYSKILKTAIDTGYKTQLSLVVNEQDKDALEALRARDKSGRNRLLGARGLKTFDSMSQTHTLRIMRQIQQGVAKNETIDQVASRVAGTFRDPEKMAAKAKTIARTETLTAVSIGQAAAMENAQEVFKGEMKKAWITANDERVRETHEGAQQDGVIPADEEFSNGLKYPRDLNGGPGETINCRCTLVMIPPGTNFDEI